MKFYAREVKNVINDYVGISITDKVAQEILDYDRSLVTEIAEFTVHDTCVREQIFEAMGQLYVGSHWPTYADNEEYTNSFHHKLSSVLNNRGCTVDE